MKVKSNFSIFFLFLAFGILSANPKVDSLYNELHRITNDRDKVLILLDLGERLYSINQTSSDSCLEEALVISKTLNFQQGYALYYFTKGAIHYNNNNYKNAILYFEQSLKYAKEPEFKKTSLLYDLLAFSYQMIGDLDNALKNAENLREFHLRNHNKEKAMISNIKLGNLFLLKNDYYQSLNYYLEALKFARELNEIQTIADCYVNIGIINKNIRKFDEAKNFTLKALELNKKIGNQVIIANNISNLAKILICENKPDSALTFFNQSLKISESLNNTVLMINNLSEIASIYLNKKEYQNAVKNFEKARELSNGLSRQYEFCYSSVELANALIISGINLKRGFNLLNESLPYALNTNDERILSFIYNSLSIYYEKTGNFRESLNYYKKHQVLKDTLVNRENIKEIGKLEGKFEKEMELLDIQRQKKEQEEKLIQKTIIISSGAGILSLCIFLIILWRQKSKSEKLRIFIETIVNLSPDILYIYDLLQNKINYINDGIFKILGYSIPEIQEKGSFLASDLMHPDDYKYYVNKILVNYKNMKDNELNTFAYRIKNKNNEWRWLESTEIVYKRLSNGLPEQIFGVVHDITDKVEYEEKLIIAKDKAEESDRLKTSFLQNISHEIRTPLNGILGFIDLLQIKSISKEDRDGFIEKIKLSSDRLLSIINNVLDMSLIDTKQYIIDKTLVNAYDVLQIMLYTNKIQSKDKNLELLIDLEPDIAKPAFYTDFSILKKALNSIIDNAIKFTYEGSVSIGYKLDSNHIIFCIKDTGIGIKSEDQERIFNKFVQLDYSLTRKQEGTGIGLTLAKAQIELLGGEISVESELGKGSTFFIKLPMDVQTDINNNHDKSLDDVDYTGFEILIVDDDISSLKFYTTALKPTKATVHQSISGYDAVELCKINENISIVFMDINMPGMDGYTALYKIKSLRPDLPVIAQTAYNQTENLEKAFEAGFDQYLTKPVSKKDLIELLNNFLIRRN